MAKILWVQDEFEGPVNGLAEYKGEKVWFARIDGVTVPSSLYAPPIISSTDVPVPIDEIPNYEKHYCLSRLTDECLKEVTLNHLRHSEETGSPLNHGDPIKIRRRAMVNKMKTPIVQEDENMTIRSLGKITTYNHKVNPQNIRGEYFDTIKESQFTNFMMPHRVEMI